MAITFNKTTFKNNQPPAIDAAFLNGLQDKIKEDFTDVDSRVTTLEEKSTNNSDTDYYLQVERETNKVWIDTRTIYRKVINIGSITAGKQYNISPNIDDLYEVVNLYGTYKLSADTNSCVPFNFYNVMLSKGSYLYYNNGVLRYYADFDAINAVVVIEYTKQQIK